MAKDFDLNPDKKAGSDKRPLKGAAIPFDSARRGKQGVRPVNSDQAKSAASWPGLLPRSLAGAGPLFLLGITLLCTLYPELHSKKSTATKPKPNEEHPASATSSPTSAGRPLATQAPAATARPEPAKMPARHAKLAPTLPGVPATDDYPITYVATHRKAFGGCTGQLELTAAALYFKCSHQADLAIPVSIIATTHKDGVVLESGEKYHFLIANCTKDQVEVIFNLWLKRVRQLQPASRQTALDTN